MSRSTASAYLALCALQPDIDERAHAQSLRQAAPFATPNPMIVALGDELMGRKGRMRNAIHNIGRGEDCFEGTPFRLNIGHPSNVKA